MIIDPTTRQAFPKFQVEALFPSFEVPTSANFNGCVQTGREQKVHVNPAKSVKLTQNKYKLFEKLAAESLPVPKYHQAFDLLEDGYFCIDNLEESFGENWGEFPLHLRTNSMEKLITDLNDAFEAAEFFSELSNVLFQSAISMPKVVEISAIPAMSGKNMRLGKSISTNGILTGHLDAVLAEEMFDLVKTLLELIDLDYGTVTMGYDDENFEVFDVRTNLIPSHVPGISHFIEMMCHEAQKSNRGKK